MERRCLSVGLLVWDRPESWWVARCERLCREDDSHLGCAGGVGVCGLGDHHRNDVVGRLEVVRVDVLVGQDRVYLCDVCIILTFV